MNLGLAIRAASDPTGSTLGPWPAHKEILQDVIALGWSQFVLADRTLKHPVGRSGLALHTDDLVACLAVRAGECAGVVAIHARNMH